MQCCGTFLSRLRTFENFLYYLQRLNFRDNATTRQCPKVKKLSRSRCLFTIATLSLSKWVVA